MPVSVRGDGTLELRLAGAEQAMHTPPLALATMLHRSVALVHGARDIWSDPDESALLVDALREAGNAPGHRMLPEVSHDLAEASDGVIDEIARQTTENFFKLFGKVPRPAAAAA